ncbi:hypothetical protein LCGC14_2422750 [marine sediment metagenome]|uniref:Pyruvate-flavodoxin oxidoreductase EKR domain-containing protein n=1 Tax=marine sediment metagenome TaxID=412755 RepID=A0A0F9BPA6_9ZZZZ
MRPPVPEDAPDFVKEVTAELIALRGDKLPVSKMPVDGKFPSGTTRYEKRNIAVNIPQWEPDICIQCGLCSLINQCIYLSNGLLSRSLTSFSLPCYRP